MIDYNAFIIIRRESHIPIPYIRNTNITIYKVLRILAENMSFDEVLSYFPELTDQHVLACLAFVADQEPKIVSYNRGKDPYNLLINLFLLWLLCFGAFLYFM